ncbi:Mu transposase C-terminal domain-containing protein [Rhizobium sp. NFR12]|uniref:Mu transposase C-terminal domain-containing protein n=1 Tax=Rhizobium sp. NFR12 TaxID=1566261 RepID=UPI0008A799BD|nr:Mu transposase C-terminal domain-containing protein [Rhizobium sp. NFR12]SEH24080.1 putative transposase [Rhizobium sp. NFR12]
MSIHGKMGSFLNAENLMYALDEADLELPVEPTRKERSPVPVQRFLFVANQIVALYNNSKGKMGYFQAISLDKHGGTEKWTFQSTLGGGRVYLSHWQIAVMEGQRRIRPLENGKEKSEARRPEDILSVDDVEEAEARKKRDYCLALIEATDGGKVPLVASLKRKVAAEVAQKVGDKKVPCNTTLDGWLKKYKKQPWNRLLALVNGTSRGNTAPRFHHLMEALIADMVKETWQDTNGKGTDVLQRLEDALAQDENAAVLDLIEKGVTRVPSSRTLERRFYGVDLYVRDCWRYDEETAARNNGFFTGRSLPDHALGVVEVDYTSADISVYDDYLPILFGRPHVIFLKDKKTGSVIGFGIHFENESYQTFLATLRQAMYPKDMSEYPGITWHQYGPMLVLVVDNAKFFVGDDMRHACVTLGIDLLENRPGEPYGKGGVEQMFHQLNQKVFHRLPGTTMSNVEKLKKFPDSKGLGKPVILLSALIQFVTLFIAEYHDTPRLGIGNNPRVKKTPNQAWLECMPDLRPRLPIDPHLFVSLAGNTDELTIQSDGITWDHIKYCSADLLALHAHPRNKRRKRGFTSTRYKVTRDPSDLGRIWVRDPYRKISIEVPAVGTWAKYADGLTLFQHQAIVKYYNTTSKRPVKSADDLRNAKRGLTRKLRELEEDRGRGKTATANILAFHGQMTKKLRKSQIVAIPDSEAVSGEQFDLDNPQKVGRAGAKSPRNPESYQGNPERHVTADPDLGIVESDPQAAAVEERANAPKPNKPRSGPKRNAPAVTTSNDDIFKNPDALAAMLKEMGYDK